MIKNKILQITLLLSIVIIGFVPWLDEMEARQIIKQRFSSEYRADRPMFSGRCQLIEIGILSKIPFAYKVEVEWKCGDRNTETGNIYVTFLKTTIGVPLE